MKWRIALGLIFAALVAAFFAFDLAQYFSFENLKTQHQHLSELRDQKPVRLIAVVFVSYTLGTALALPIPGVMSLVCGALSGLPGGVLISSFSSSIGSTLGFLRGRFVFGEALQQRFAERFGAIDQGVRREGAFYLFSIRLVPVFPLSLINLAMALTPIKTWTFYWVSQLGMLPASIVWVNAGTQLATLESPGDILTPKILGAFALLVAMPFVGKFVLGLLRRQRSEGG